MDVTSFQNSTTLSYGIELHSLVQAYAEIRLAGHCFHEHPGGGMVRSGGAPKTPLPPPVLSTTYAASTALVL
jgi:hypothetical protein